VISHGPKFREPQHINWKHNFKIIAIGDNRNRLIFEIWWNFFYDLFSIKNVVDVNSIDSFVSKRNMEEISLSMCEVKIFLTFTSPNMVLL
jgi:hypothetical protein